MGEFDLADPHAGRAPLEDVHVLRGLETPCYVYDPSLVEQDYAELKRALGTALIVSIKANPDPGLLAACAPAFADGIELASRGELEIARALDVAKFVNTPGMTAALMEEAVGAGATLVLDNLAQVGAVAALRSSPAAPVVLRLNSGELLPDAARRGPADRFGMSLADIVEAGRQLRRAGIGLGGLHVFAGSNLLARAARPLAERLTQVVPDLERSLGHIGFLNLGGGVPPDWRDQKFDFSAYRDMLGALQAGRELAHEAGRAVFTRCGAFVTRVLSRKQLGGHAIVACDGGMVHAFQLAQTELPIKLFRSPRVIPADDAVRARAEGPVLFVGNTCSNMDRIGLSEAVGLLPEPGDFCVFRETGAYFATYTLAGFLGIAPARAYVMRGARGLAAD